MELRHLRYVVAVAEELNFGRAAERLGISQPPLSQQIRQVEDELGVRLFHRTKRRVQLTEPGAVFVENARLVLAQADHTVKATMRASRGEIGQLTIGTVTSTDSGFYAVLVEILQIFAKKYPTVRLALRTLSVEQQIQYLLEDRIQVGFVTLPVDDPALMIETVRREPLVVALPEDHPLARQRRILPRTLAAEPHVLCPRHLAPGYYDLVVSFFRSAGFSMNIAHEGDNIYTTLALVAAGLGVSLFPASLLEVPRRGIAVRQLQGTIPVMEMGVAYRRDEESTVLALFTEVVRSVAKARLIYRGIFSQRMRER
jgi:DNA-binding transcriptional LysR family regulator